MNRRLVTAWSNRVDRRAVPLRLALVAAVAAMLGTPVRTHTGTWPSVGELDIMESINAVATEFGTMHCGSNPGGPCNESSGIGGRQSCSACWGQFHTYTIEWDKSVTPETIRWFLDGTQFFSINATRNPRLAAM